MEVFERAQRARFEEDAVRHVEKFWPALSQQRGEKGVRELLARVFARCDELRIATEYDVLRMVNLHCAYGDGFEAEQPWAAAILRDAERPARDRLDEVMVRADAEGASGAQR